MKTFKITKKMLETMGSHSLTGRLLMDNIIPTDETVKLLFQQTTMDYKQKHDGPEQIIVWEHLPMVLCEDVLSLVKNGVKLEIGEYNED